MGINNEKILLIAYLSEPNNYTGMYRTKGYMQYLHQYGYYPILISRNWNQEKSDVIVEEGTGTRHLLYTKESTREKLNRKYKSKFTFIRKGYNLTMKIFMCFNLDLFFEYKHILKIANEILSKNKDIKKAIVISDPYEFFYIGYKLNRKHGIKWIADYRDPWNTTEHIDSYSGKRSKFLHTIESYKEKKWVGTASYITCVSDYCTRKIVDFVKIPGKTIYNGFFEKDESIISSKKGEQSDIFRIVYSGTLYEQQILEVFANGFKQFIDHNPKAKIEVHFIGIRALEGAYQRIERLFKGYEEYIKATERISQIELFDYIKKAQLLLTITLGRNVKGMISSKIFDYLLSGKPILISPLEDDVVEQILTASGQGFFADTPEEIVNVLTKLYDQFVEKGYIEYSYNKNYILRYSRENQTKEMALLLDGLSESN